MTEYYGKKKTEEFISGEMYLKDINLHLPEWVRKFAEIYTSELKYKIRKDLN